MKDYAILLLPLVAAAFCTCGTAPATPITQPLVYAIKAPVAGNYPQGLYKYPYKENTSSSELFVQTLDWIPAVPKTFDVNTQYTALLTLTPASPSYTFDGVQLEDVQGLPAGDVVSLFAEKEDGSMVIHVVFKETASSYAEPELLFYDDFDGDTLDNTKWAACPDWDRQGRSTWDSQMVSVRDGYLRLGFKRDTELGKTKTSKTALSDNWIRAGAVRTRKTDNSTALFENGFGYYEARIQFPPTSGMWGAFWLMSPTQWILTDEGAVGTEIDIVESIDSPREAYNAALHWNGYGSKHKSTGSTDIAQGINIYDGDFHVFALDWSPSEYIFYVDGVEFWRCDGGSRYANSGINRNPNYIKLTVEGADWSPALPLDFSEGEMLVDYVKVYNQPKALP